MAWDDEDDSAKAFAESEGARMAAEADAHEAEAAEFRRYDVVRIKAKAGPETGTVMQITKHKVRVLFPVHRYAWLLKSEVTKI